MGVVMMGLFRAFDCFNHELLITKLDAYGFSRSALLFIHSCMIGSRGLKLMVLLVQW